VRAIKEVSHDPRCKREIQLDSGRKLTAVQLQREYCELAAAYVGSRSHELHPSYKDVVEMWQRVLESLERDPMELADEIDWVAKKAMIEGFMERKGLDWDSSQVRLLDLQFHDLRPEKGLYFLLERQGRVKRLVGDDEIDAAIQLPPEDTRAYFRGQCLKHFAGEVFGVNWDSISFGIGDEPIKRILMAEPLKGTRHHVDDLLASSKSAAELVRNLRA